jgi:predicted metal-binding protein
MNTGMNDWVARARELGVDDAIIIPATQVVVADWVRLKCQYGCSGYGECLTCPPYSPTPETTRRLLTFYSKALLVRFDGNRGEDEHDRFHRRLVGIIAELEREIFLEGDWRTWAMSSGPCSLCESCNVKKSCQFPEQARPSMEACGVDVFSTARNAGWKIEVVQSLTSCFRLFGLILMS